ncbi:MAG: hypothetical protein LJE67_00125 [Salaquimonas sp.]|nr:hypothetical protein [Salaquimonas sp.]
MAKQKFATQIEERVLSDIRDLAKVEGRQLQAVIEEALTELLENRKRSNARPHVMAAYQASHARYGSLYEKLAQ